MDTGLYILKYLLSFVSMKIHNLFFFSCSYIKRGERLYQSLPYFLEALKIGQQHRLCPTSKIKVSTLSYRERKTS